MHLDANVDRLFPEFIARSRIPRARPSQTSSQVKHSFTFSRSGSAAATQESLRNRFPDPSKVPKEVH